jgi:NADH-quinone oxidoreductase chain G
MITITINGRTIELQEPVTVLEAAEMNGISIPHLCSHPLLEAYGGCRMCLVEVERMHKLQTACTLMVTEGMTVRTESPEITKARRAMLEFLLINHPLECPECDKAGECSLQDYTHLYGASAGRFGETKLLEPESLEDPLIVRNMERCIRCTRCVRMCDGVQGASAIAVTGRGARTFIKPFSEGTFNCEYCGNCITVCPVGSIMSRLHRYAYRPWQIDKEVLTVCPYCGVGCSFVVQVREEVIQRVMPSFGTGVNKGLLCVRGFFGYEYVNNRERLTTPLIRKGGKLQEASWDEALTAVAEKLMDIRTSHGGGSIAGIASARCTNEDNYLFQKLMRAGLQTNNIDSIARTGYAGSQGFLEGMLGEGSTANLISGVRHSDAVLLAGGDPTQVNPILGINVRDAYRKGAKVITLGCMPGLKAYMSNEIMHLPYTEGLVLAALLSGVLQKKHFSGKKPELEETIRRLDLPAITDIKDVCNEEALTAARDELAKAPAVSIVLGAGVMTDSSTLLLLGALAYLLDARVYLMSERPNEQGVIDMGCTPDKLSGGGPVDSESIREKHEKAWGVQLPEEQGMTIMEFVEGSHSGTIKAMYVMGENPVFNLPDSGFVKEALQRLDFLVVQDIFLTETAELADVVLPAACWAEKEGTFVNLERRLQLLRRAVQGKGMEDWRILSRLGDMLGLHMPYADTEDIMAEIAGISSLHSGLSYDDIESGMDLWPYKGTPLRQTSGPGFEDTYRRPPVPEPDGKLHIGIEQPLFHSGTLSRHSSALNSVYPEAVARLNRKTAERHALNDGDMAAVSSAKGSVSVPVHIDESVPEYMVMLGNNFKDKGVMGILGYDIEPTTKAPALRTLEATIQKVGV